MKSLKNTIWTAVGLFGLAALVAMPSAADQQILDDLIVVGSACVGQDCVNGESFGFDTIRIKENNLRIKAQDTSTSASFPTQDWQLTFNDSSNGGQNRFSVECVGPGSSNPFTVEGCAPSHSLYVRSNGNVGFGTSAPVADLHVKSGNTPTLRLEQDGSSGFSAQTWDVAGNEANFFIRDATNGSTLPFRIRPGVATSAIDVYPGRVEFRGTSNGDLNLKATRGTGSGDFAELTFQEGTADQWGIGSYGESDQLYIYNYTAAQYSLSVEADNDVGIGCRGTNDHDLTINSGNATCIAGTYSQIDAGDTAFTASSSRTIKENLEPVKVDGLLDRIAEIPVYTYDFIDGKKDSIGLMAEDFHQIFGRGSDKTLSGHEMQVALWLAIQELTARNQELTERLAAIEAARE